MRTKSLISAICAAAVAIAPASLSAQAAQSGTAAKEKQAKPRKICRDLETTGTRFRERVCLTKEEWKLVEQQR